MTGHSNRLLEVHCILVGEWQPITMYNFVHNYHSCIGPPLLLISSLAFSACL